MASDGPVSDDGPRFGARECVPLATEPATMLNVPAAYLDGYARARSVDREVADNYIRHTTIGDPELDPVMEELARLPPAEMHRFIRAGVEQDDDATLRRAPRALRDFFDNVQVPDWVDFETFEPGQRAFYANVSNMLIAYAVGSAVEGFSTLVSKSFSITGRVPNLGPGAVRRLRWNNRHMIETYFPGGLLQDGEGWKISTRIRFIHARVRALLAESGAWDQEAWGTPLSAAHLGGISLFTFSVRKFEHAASLGSKITAEERESITAVWRYVGHILGVPEAMLFTDREAATRLYRIAHLCEPPPDDDSRAVANAVFKAIPVMAGLTDESEKQRLALYAYKLSRALIGHPLANRLGYPKTSTFGTLPNYRARAFLRRQLHPRHVLAQDSLSQIFDAAQYDREGISYRMPDHARAAQQSPW